MRMWQPIETAPRDGTRIWVAEVTDEYTNTFEARWCTHYGHDDIDAPKVGGLMTSWWALSWRVGDRKWEGVADRREHSPYGRANLVAAHPTHWMPLPPTPETVTVNEGEKK